MAAVAGWLADEKPVGCDWPDDPPAAYVAAEVARCMADPVHFVDTYCSVEETAGYVEGDESDNAGLGGGGRHVRFRLWPLQRPAVWAIHRYRRVVALKARQIGATWFTLAYCLRQAVFYDNSTILLFSKRDQESIEMLRRVKGMFARLPDWLKPADSYDARGRLRNAAGHQWSLANGSRVMSFPTGTGDSYTASIAVIDEADLVPDLDRQLGSVKPTVDNGGKLVLLSRSNKKLPESPFKNLCRAAMAGGGSWRFVFLPWYAHPQRTRAWYDRQAADSVAQTFSLDSLWEQYPETPEQALAANQLDKRFPEAVMAPLFAPAEDLCVGGAGPAARWREPEGDPGVMWVEGDTRTAVWREAACPAIPGLRVYRLPEAGGWYTIGADPAQGLPNSCDSAVCVIDDRTGEEVASCEGKSAPKATARYCAELCDWYKSPAESRCAVMPEHNNHGQAFLQWWQSNRADYDYAASILRGPAGEKGWNQTEQSKETMWHRVAQRVTDGRLVIHTRKLYNQLVSIEADSLAAPAGQMDDAAVAFALAVAGADTRRKSGFVAKALGVH